MSDVLMLVAIGPVQEFIAQARRTRDLWYGSHLLSEISRRAATALVAEGATLVFPALDAGSPELEVCLAPRRPDTNEPPLNVANRILATIPSKLDPRAVAKAVRTAIQEFWRDEIAAPIRRRRTGLIADTPATEGTPTIEEIWNEQIETLLEFTAAWAPLGSYEEARSQVETAVAARKNLRDFEQWSCQRGAVPKSSLDGARETILRPPRQRDQRLARQFRIAETEQLDAVGLVKRAGGEPEQFVPVANVALASWIDAAAREAPEALQRLREACRQLGLDRVVRDLPATRSFPFDASVLLPSRWMPVFEEQGLSGDPESWGRRHVQPLLRQLPEPFPYVVCLVADGDRMGDAIKAIARSAGDDPSKDEDLRTSGAVRAHRQFSGDLSGFATRARSIVEQEHRGSLVYAGGDDVLAFLPLPEALACADALRVEFEATMTKACAALNDDLRPTLSVGLGVGHLMEGMGELLKLGRDAETLAKGAQFRDEGRDRNSLAVIVDKRSGGRCQWRARWDEEPVRRVELDVEALREELPSRKVYEIAQTLRRLPRPDQVEHDRWATVLRMEIRRTLARIEATETMDPESIGLNLEDEVPYRVVHANVEAWVGRMLVARNFAAAACRSRRAEDEDDAA